MQAIINIPAEAQPEDYVPRYGKWTVLNNPGAVKIAVAANRVGEPRFAAVHRQSPS